MCVVFCYILSNLEYNFVCVFTTIISLGISKLRFVYVQDNILSTNLSLHFNLNHNYSSKFLFTCFSYRFSPNLNTSFIGTLWSYILIFCWISWVHRNPHLLISGGWLMDIVDDLCIFDLGLVFASPLNMYIGQCHWIAFSLVRGRMRLEKLLISRS